MKQELKRIGEIAILVAIFGWFIWSFIASGLEDYERLEQTHSSSEALWTLVQQRSIGLLSVAAVFLLGSWVVGWLTAWHRKRVYRAQAGDEVLSRQDFPDEPALVLRRERLFLFRGNRPDVLIRSAIHDFEVRSTDDGIVVRVLDDRGNTWNYHWILEDGEVDVPQLRQWVTDWMVGRTPSTQINSSLG